MNCGVAEANMTSMAAGMALCGLAAGYLHHRFFRDGSLLGADTDRCLLP